MADVIVTHHARRRTQQRLRRRDSAAHEAWEHGVRIEEMRGRLRDLVAHRIETHGKGVESRVYRGAIWIFEPTDDGPVLITVYRVPISARRLAAKLERRRRK